MMQMNTLDGWPHAARCIITCAQRLADARGHAETTAAHVSDVLYRMKPVRRLVAATLTPAVVESALLVERKASVTRAHISPPLAAVLFGPSTRTTAELLRTFASGHAVAKRIGPTFAEHAQAIATLLDHPGIEPLVRDATSTGSRAGVPELTVALSRAQKGKHAEVTTRHVVLGALVVFDGHLKVRELPGLETAISRLTELIERTTSRSEGLVIEARLFGALAGLLADGTLETDLTMACLEDDDAVAFAAEALEEGQELLFPAAPPEQG
ncbi:hypothetical protein BH11MYX4_BH11MYX4_61700 [soil metagenome]